MRAMLTLTSICAALLISIAARDASACTNPTCLTNFNPSTGTILPAPTIWVVYWGSDWGSSGTCSVTACANDTLARIPLVEGLFRGASTGPSVWGGLPGTKWFGVEKQYNGLIINTTNNWYYQNYRNIAPAASWFDFSAVPQNPTTADAQHEAQVAANHFTSMGYAIDSNALVVIALGPGSTYPYCAQHAIAGANTPPSFMVLPYPYQLGCDYDAPPTGLSQSVSQYSALLEHEFAEAVTDPQNWYGSSFRTWQNQSAQETADACQAGTIAPTLAVAAQPSGVAAQVQAAIQRVSNRGGSSGACVFARTSNSDAFTIGTNNHLYHEAIVADSNVTNSGWYDWGTLGTTGTLSTNPAAVSWSNGRTDVFVKDNVDNGHLRHAYVDGVNGYCPGANSPCYDDWGQLPAGWLMIGAPTVASWGPARLDVFTMGYASAYGFHLFHRVWDNFSDSGWVDRGAFPVSPAYGPTSSAYSPGTVDVFSVGSDNSIYHGLYTQSGNTFTWSFWHAAPSTASIADSVDGASWLPGRFDVMVVDANGALYDCGADTINGVLTPWSSCVHWTPPTIYRCNALHICYWSGAAFRSKPSVIGLGDQRILVAAVDNYDNLGWLQLWDFGQNTGGWVSTGGVLPWGIELTSW